MHKGTKYAVVNNYKRMAVPVEFLPKLLEVAILVETSYDNGRDYISSVHDIDKVEIYDGEEFDIAIAEAKLKN